MASVKSSWDKAQGSWDKAGPELFMKLFNDDKIYAKFQSKIFNGADKGSVKDTEAMKNQCKAFANLITKWVGSIGDDAALTTSCNGFAASHKAMGVSAAQVEAAFAEFRNTMKQFGGDDGEWKGVTEALMAKISPGLQ